MHGVISMNQTFSCCTCCVALLVCLAERLPAEEPVTLDNLVAPEPNLPDEPTAARFDKAKAVHFLDSASLNWQKERKCFTCHTNYLYLYARPAASGSSIAHTQVREFAEELVQQRWPTVGPRWDAEVVATAAALAFNDSKTTGELHPATREALDRMWDIQRPDGGWTLAEL